MIWMLEVSRDKLVTDLTTMNGTNASPLVILVPLTRAELANAPMKKCTTWSALEPLRTEVWRPRKPWSSASTKASPACFSNGPGTGR